MALSLSSGQLELLGAYSLQGLVKGGAYLQLRLTCLLPDMIEL